MPNLLVFNNNGKSQGEKEEKRREEFFLVYLSHQEPLPKWETVF